MFLRLSSLLALVLLFGTLGAQAQESPAFIGSDACGACPPDAYGNLSKYAKKANSWRSIQLMASDLSPLELAGCYACHTTGYNQPGGFKSITDTPHLKNAGCEVCHGPGSLHRDSGGDPTLIKASLQLSDCEGCHNQERVKTFNFKPLLHGGAH